MTSTQKTPSDRTPSPEGGRFRCVIVDDERRAREILSHLLSRYVPLAEVVATAGSVTAALEAIERESPDVVFLDIEIIGGTGFDVLDAIDARSFLAVFITAHENYRINSGRYPNARFLAKPLDIEELQEALRGLGMAGQQGTASTPVSS